MRMTCKIVTDFAELYQAGIVSPETAKAIHSHLRGCQNCRKYYHEYQAMQKQKSRLRFRFQPEDMSGTEEKLYMSLSRKLRRRRLCEIAAIGAGSVMLTVGLLLTYRGSHTE